MTTFAATHPPVPEDPALLEGPRVGELRVFTSPAGTTVVRIVARSYVWAPEQPNYDGTYGTRHYDWSVVTFLTGGTCVINDRDLKPLWEGWPAHV